MLNSTVVRVTLDEKSLQRLEGEADFPEPSSQSVRTDALLPSTVDRSKDVLPPSITTWVPHVGPSSLSEVPVCVEHDTCPQIASSELPVVYEEDSRDEQETSSTEVSLLGALSILPVAGISNLEEVAVFNGRYHPVIVAKDDLSVLSPPDSHSPSWRRHSSSSYHSEPLARHFPNDCQPATSTSVADVLSARDGSKLDGCSSSHRAVVSTYPPQTMFSLSSGGSDTGELTIPVESYEGQLRGEEGCQRYQVGFTVGWRSEMEDAHVVVPDFDIDRELALVAVFDGHGGREVSHYLQRALPLALRSHPLYEKGDIGGALRATFLELDALVCSNECRQELYELAMEPVQGAALAYPAQMWGRFDDSDQYMGPAAGSTATVVLLHGDHMFIANVGDSSAILVSGGKPVHLTRDHKAVDEQEVRRVIQAGGYILRDRVCGDLDMARAFGDAEYKQNHRLGQCEQMVVAEPDVGMYPIKDEDQWLILATDGLWNSLDTNEVAAFLVNRQKKGCTLRDTVRALCWECCIPSKSAYDNVTIVVVELQGRAAAGTSGHGNQ